MRKEVMGTVERELGAIAHPGQAHFVSLLPKTRSGELLRRSGSIHALAEGREPGDVHGSRPSAIRGSRDAGAPGRRTL